MIIKDNRWIGAHRGDMVVLDSSCNKTVIMVMIFLGFVPYIPTALSS